MGDREIQRRIQEGLYIQDWRSLGWQSDWNGYPEVLVVGLYSTQEGTNLYINIETGQVLEAWEDEEE